METVSSRELALNLFLLENTGAPIGCMENHDDVALQAHCFARILQTTPNCGVDPSHLWAAD